MIEQKTTNSNSEAGILNYWIKSAPEASLQAVKTEVASLKKSVSDGKTLVAGAITDKGITTATDAAFATMADNISQISTLAADTTDATATTAQILAGAKAYVKGLPVVGTMPNNGGPSTAIAAGKLKAGYTSGGAIANLVAGNVKRGVNIGGVTGNMEEQVSFSTSIAVGEIYIDKNNSPVTKTYNNPIKWLVQGETTSNHILSVALIDQKQLLTRASSPSGQDFAKLTKATVINPLKFSMYSYLGSSVVNIDLSEDRKTITITLPQAMRAHICVGF